MFAQLTPQHIANEREVVRIRSKAEGYQQFIVILWTRFLRASFFPSISKLRRSLSSGREVQSNDAGRRRNLGLLDIIQIVVVLAR
jgi:hypothetical protein